MAGDPRINPEFPIGESLSPPFVGSPIYECAEAVHVSGFVPHAIVRVWANGNDLVAEDAPAFGFVDLALRRPLARGESITATQTVGAITSVHSYVPVIVAALVEGEVRTRKPDVGDDLYECGIVVPVGNLVPSVRVHVAEDGTEIGSAPVAQTWVPVGTAALHAAHAVTAQQIACEGSDHQVEGVWSDAVTVKAAPVPTPAPAVDAASLIVGNDAVTLTGLLVGAGVEVTDRGAGVGGGYATGATNWCPIQPPLGAASQVRATQELCGHVSASSGMVKPEGRLPAPTIVGPICAGTQFVIVRDTVVNATVVVLANGTPVAYGGAGPGDVVLALGGGASLAAGQSIVAIQNLGQTISPPSAAVIVSASITTPSVEIMGGHPFFIAKSGEQAIDGPVFPRGAGPGPSIHVQSCCDKTPEVEVHGPGGERVATLRPDPLFPGYYVGTWPWTWGTTPRAKAAIPVGRYTLRVRTGCDQEDGRATFYVVFDPAEVNGPKRFSFDDTAVWFGTGTNSIRGLHYYLHQSDARVFGVAIDAASGMTDPFAGAVAVARAEEALFGYSLSYHTQDVVDLITNYTQAQCADDACCLTALLRAVGIPAHPTTADAGLETGAANWTFDTWVEFLASHGGTTEWWVLHPHEYPGMQPESRSTFGTTRGVATKATDDVIVMGGEGWLAAALDDGTADVTYTRNACGEPVKALTKAAWIGELCEDGYWPAGHWVCEGVQPMSARIGHIEITEGARFGDALRGVVRLPTTERAEEIRVELLTHRLDSKGVVEDSVDDARARVERRRRARPAARFELRLPETVPPGRELNVRALVGDRVVAIGTVDVPSVLEAEIEPIGVSRLGEEFEIRARFRNVSREEVADIEVVIALPFALITDEPSQRVRSLRPGARTTIVWRCRAVAALRSGAVHVVAAGDRGGGVDVRRHIEVVAEAVPTGTTMSIR